MAALPARRPALVAGGADRVVGLHTYAADTYATESLLLAPSKGLRLALLLCVQPAFDDRDREAREHRTRHEIGQHRVRRPEPGQRGQRPIAERDS